MTKPEYVLLNCLLFISWSLKAESYTHVVNFGSGVKQDDGPKVYKALNMDLIFPKSFNSSENVISTTQTSAPQRISEEASESLLSTTDEQFTPEHSSSQTSAGQPPLEPAIPANHYHPSFVIHNNHADSSEESEVMSPPSATGRAVDQRPAYPFSQLLTPNSKGYRPSSESYKLRSRPVSKPNTAQRVVYPSYQAPRTPSRAEIDKLSGKGTFSDRFTPSEAVASSFFKKNQNRNPSISRPIGQSSNKVPSIVETKDLYSFPPNIDSRYPLPSDSKQSSPSDAITSYLPPPAGPLDTVKFIGPVNPDLLPDNIGKPVDEAGNGYKYNPPQSDNEVKNGYQYNPPKTPEENDDMNSDNNNEEGSPSAPMDDMRSAMEDDVSMGMDSPASSDDVMHDNSMALEPEHDHHQIGGYVDGKEYPTPPPGYLEEHNHNHHADIDFDSSPYFRGHHHHDYPDIIYDDYHDHDHIHHHPKPPPITTEAPPPPPAPEQPRVKKYSYFYIGRKLWYIPLYFTVWFTFYVLWLILKSIARHKVNLPNHYVTRRSIEDMSHFEARKTIDKLTIKVMDGIERFKLKFL